MRGHDPVKFGEFNGLWKRGDAESCPADHFSDCNNISYIQSGFKSRDGIESYLPFPNVKRIYTYNTPSQQSLLVLDTNGNIYDSGSPTPTTAILSIATMTDFAFQAVAGRAYLSPHNGTTGLENEFVYVYMGDGSYARKAAGIAPAGGTFTAANSGTAGKVEPGVHIFGIVFETDTGFLTKIGAVKSVITAPGSKKVDLTNINTGATYVKARHIVATRAIDITLYTGDVEGYQFFFVPGGKISDNSTTSLTVDFYDSDLLEDASYTLDLLETIPAGVNLGTYHERMILLTEFGEETGNINTTTISNIATVRVSFPGEPEAFSSVDGLMVAPQDSTALTNAQEYRDVLYLFKLTKTYAYNDNGDVPSTWPLTIIDTATGSPVHGVASVLDTGAGVNIDYLVLADYSGIILFNGGYIRPELSFKIHDYWFLIDRSTFRDIQLVNDPVGQIIYAVLPTGIILIGDYANGLTKEEIRWGIWTFDCLVTGVTLIHVNELIIGSSQAL